jgi:hypothetical protein
MNPSLSAWLLVASSVIAEVVGTVALKYSDGFSKLLPSVAAATCYALAIWLMAVAMRQLDMGSPMPSGPRAAQLPLLWSVSRSSGSKWAPSRRLAWFAWSAGSSCSISAVSDDA